MTKPTCSIEGCDKPATKRTWCGMHYRRWHRYGSTDVVKQTPPGVAQAHFEANLMTVTDECKIWPFSTARGGYGQFSYQGRVTQVHILACIAFHGPRPEGAYAAHGPCHNPACWNGAHLSWKTPSENQMDRHRDGTISNQYI